MHVAQLASNGTRRSRVFGASMSGPMHVQREIPCQDACASAATSSDVIVIAVADGLGSAPKSDLGATFAVDSAFRHCMTVLELNVDGTPRLEEVVRNGAIHAREQLESRTRDESCKLRDLGCTLIVVVSTSQQIAVAHIGDGAVVTDTDGSLSLISGPGESEYTNEVVPLTSPEWQNALRITSINSSISGVAVFTDGCQRAAFRKVQDNLIPFEGFFGPIFAYAREVVDTTEGANEIARLLASAKLCEHSDDDKTLVIGVLEVE